MQTPLTLANRFQEVLLNGTWIAGTNFKHQLADVDWNMATTKIGELNTIAKLTFHINYYIAGILNVFEGEELAIHDKFSFDLSESFNEKDWNDLVFQLISNSERFAEHVETMTNDQLNAVFVDAKYGDYRRNIEGVIEHSYYHLGQVSLIKKMILSKNSI